MPNLYIARVEATLAHRALASLRIQFRSFILNRIAEKDSEGFNQRSARIGLQLTFSELILLLLHIYIYIYTYTLVLVMFSNAREKLIFPDFPRALIFTKLRVGKWRYIFALRELRNNRMRKGSLDIAGREAWG